MKKATTSPSDTKRGPDGVIASLNPVPQSIRFLLWTQEDALWLSWILLRLLAVAGTAEACQGNKLGTEPMKLGQMAKDDNPNYRPVVAATIAASILMLAFGLTYHALAVRLGAYMTISPIVPEVVQRLPMQIGSWTGQDVPLDEAIVRATGTDAHINRRYSRRNGLESVSLYVACGVNARNLVVHRPEVCYISAGLTLMNRRSVELSLNDGTRLPCSVLDFSRGGLNTNQVTALYYFIVDGQCCGDVSLLQSRAWRGSDTVAYVAQVQIVASSKKTLTTDSTVRIVSDFAVDSALSIAQLFEDAGEKRTEDKNAGEEEGKR